jgi:hypothetical protein
MRKGQKVKCIDNNCCGLPLGEYKILGTKIHKDGTKAKTLIKLPEKNHQIDLRMPWKSCGKCIKVIPKKKGSK